MTNENIAHSYQGYLTFLKPDSISRRGGDFGPITSTVTDIQHNLKGDFRLAGLRHRFIWGLDYVAYRTSRNSRGTLVLDTINITKPISVINEKEMEYAYSRSKNSGYGVDDKYQQMASYVSDVINLTDNLLVLASVRFDRYMLQGTSGYNQNSWTPRFGIVYQPVKDRVSVFGNYNSGFTNYGVGTQPDGSRFVYKPSFARQWEGGIKANAWQNRLTGSLSYYTIDIADAPRSDPDGTLHQDGRQQSKGFEADLRATPVKGLSITAGYGRNENKYTRSANNQGKLVTGSPKNVANCWISYRFSGNEVLQHFGIGAGLNYADAAYFDADNTISIPSYTYVNTTLFYETDKWKAGVAVGNIGDRQYWNAYATPQTPRNITANLTVKF